LPIFVAYDSADVWTQRELFFLDTQGKPTFVAGVPPDYFSETGQRWGNPLYRWEVLAEQGYGWWIERMRAALSQVEVVRIDHFIGFTRYWEIPARELTAVKGRYVPGPGADFLQTLLRALGSLPLIAEDLGVVTPEVVALREQFELPGMKVLQFAFGADPTASFLPHRYTPNFVVYTGTHDNDTTTGWFATAPESERHLARRYLGRHGDDIAWDLIRLGMSSVADTFVAPVQDVLALGTEARMNHPGRATGNWTWRLCEGQLGEQHAERLRDLVEVYDRCPRQT
jgi:4-alpha-glucanotransferase